VSPEYVHPSGVIARFVFSPRDLRSDGSPKPSAFKPELHPELKRWETSVCGRNGVSDERLWHLGCTIRPDRHCKVAVEVPVPAILGVGLDCIPLPEGYDEHGVIIKWPDEDKDARLARQQDLVAARTAVLLAPSQATACDS